MGKSERLKLYADHVRGMGYVPDVVGEGEVRFKVEGGVYQIVIDDEEVYFSLIFQRFWPIQNEAQRVKAEKAAMEATAATKVVKVIVGKDNVSVNAEIYVSPPEAVQQVLKRLLQGVLYAVKTFKQKMAE